MKGVRTSPLQEGLRLLPVDWPTKPLKRIASVNPEALPETTDPNYEFDYVDIGAVDANGRVSGTERLAFEEAPSRARRCVRSDDVIVSTVRTYLKAVAHLRRAAPDLICSTGFAVLRAGHEVLPRFLYYWCRSAPFIEEVVAQSTGVSYPAIAATQLAVLHVPVPELPVQRRVAAFLDAEVSRIDALAEGRLEGQGAIARLSQLLEERRQAVITAAVTGQIDVTTAGKAA